jgi:hypothetical protein
MASQRVPVEVWEHVLHYAIACPLLPSEDDNLVNSLRFFSHYCEDTLDFMHTERTRITLQLVCKTWNAILKSQSQRFCVGSRSKLLFISSFYRVDLHHLGPRVCRCPRMIPPLELVTKQGPQLLEAVVARDWEIGLKHIENIENLRVLSLYASDRGSNFPVGLSPFAKYSRSLTHLQLWGLFLPKCAHQSLELLCLHTLSIRYGCGPAGADWNSPPANEYYYPRFSLWILPSLVYVEIAGALVPTNLGIEEDIAPLLRNVGPKLRGFAFNASTVSRLEEGSFSLPRDVWNQFTQLKSIYMKLEIMNTVPSSIMPRIWIFLREFGCHRFDFEVETYLNIYRARLWNTQGFGMDITWSQLRHKLKRNSYFDDHYLAFVYRFIQMIQWSGHSLIDRNGLGLDCEQARQAIEELQTYMASDEGKIRMKWCAKQSSFPQMWFDDEDEEDEAEFTDDEDGYTSESSGEVEIEASETPSALYYDLDESDSDDSYVP